MRERQADFALLLPSDPLSHVHVIVQPQHLRRSGGNKKKTLSFAHVPKMDEFQKLEFTNRQIHRTAWTQGFGKET